MKSTDEIFSDLALLSRAASGWCIHNPNVSAAIYDEAGNFVAHGVHKKKISDDHAEVVALKAAGERARGGALFLSLEPCNHSGKTGPCTEAIKASGIKKVVYAVADPNPVARGGAQSLKEAGIEVLHEQSPLLEFEQRAWLHRMAHGRPLITAKIAITLDGFIAASDGRSKWITNEESRNDVQQLRAQVGAIVTSTQTYLADNPTLLPRIEGAPTPLRVIMGESAVDAEGFIHVTSRNPDDLVKLLNDEGINHALVEAGGTLLTPLLKGDFIDELVVYQAPIIFGSGKKWVESMDISSLNQAMSWELLETDHFGSDVKNHYRRVRK